MTQYQVTAPEADYSGPVGKVQFTNGTATIDDERNPAELAYCRGAGYVVEEPETGEPDPDGPFDPSANSAPAVLAYLKDADEDEATRVLDAEAASKDRKGITGQRDAILASKQKEEK